MTDMPAKLNPAKMDIAVIMLEFNDSIFSRKMPIVGLFNKKDNPTKVRDKIMGKIISKIFSDRLEKVTYFL